MSNAQDFGLCLTNESNVSQHFHKHLTLTSKFSFVGPETIDRALIGCTARENPRTSCVEFTRHPSNGQNAPKKSIQSSTHDEQFTTTLESELVTVSTKNIAWTAHKAPSPPREPESASKESIIYRIHPARESKQLIYQLGTASPTLAVEAATLVAPYVAGIDVNAGCPKPFSTSGGMGAALLSTPDLLCDILRSLVKEVGEKFEIGISVKIRLLSTEPETRALVSQLVQTGITGLTIHCRTRSMRKTEKAIREQLRMVGEVCREAGVACIMNGDVENRAQAEQLMSDFGVDGAMIATAAEKNSSVFRHATQGGTAPWREVVQAYVEAAMDVENRWGNTKFLLAQLIPGKEQNKLGLAQCKNHEDICRKLGYDERLIEKAKSLDTLLGLTNRLTKSEQKAVKKAAEVEKQQKQKQMQQASKQHIQKRPGNDRDPTDDLARKEKRQKQGVKNGNFHTDLHHDIVAPAMSV